MQTPLSALPKTNKLCTSLALAGDNYTAIATTGKIMLAAGPSQVGVRSQREILRIC